ncbi:MAG TPA: type II toxin-antitoxin system HicA family toxin [bacterium]|mgnify:CR=1 FL=1|nr:type II toxin-antitoxin system HicA family toxin [bacterium]
MTPKLPRLTAAVVVKALERAGFAIVRQSGSHRVLRNRHGCRVTVPMHAGKTLHPKILKSILRDAEMSAEYFQDL